MSLQELVTPRPTRVRHGDLVHRLAISAEHRSATSQLEEWMVACRLRSPLTVDRLPLDQLAGWRFEPGSGDLVHHSGRFFAIRGIHVQTDYGHVPEWWQPIIHQPEEGILGFLAKEFDGVLHFLVQVKIEPGNVNSVQISPTVQATRSNYLRAHHGAAVPYLKYFVERGPRVLVDVLQPEQGSWFFGKRNRNMIVEVKDDLEHDDDFAWLTLGQIYELMKHPNVLNMDTRAVISCLPLPVAGAGSHSVFGEATLSSVSGSDQASYWGQVSRWLAGRRAHYTVSTTLVPLKSVLGWDRGSEGIHHWSRKYFSIIGVRVGATNREVLHWCQPLLEPCSDGLVAFVVRRIADKLYILARADVRPGYRDVVEIGPTVQCQPQNFADNPEQRPEFVDLVLSDDVTVHYDVPQSEEGGRFNHAVTRHMVVEVDASFPMATPPDYCWLTPAQLKEGLCSHQLNIEARSLVSCIQALC